MRNGRKDRGSLGLRPNAIAIRTNLVDAMPEYEERMFRVAEEMEMEVRG